MTAHAMETRQRVSEPTASRRPAGPERAGPKTHGLLDGVSVLSLQRMAGNAAAVALIQRRSQSLTAQPDRTKAGAFGEVTPAKPVGGWKGADARGPGWNVGEKEIGTMRRIPIDDLPVGKQTEDEAANDTLTDEKAGKRAILIASKNLNPNLEVDAIVHLHGYTEKFNRKTGKRVYRPFAGLRQHKDSGEVRDVALDRAEAQMEAANQPQLVGILAQGGVHSEFGDSGDEYGLDAKDYAGKVLTAAKNAGAWKVLPGLRRTILSAHSGGAHTVKTALASELVGKKDAKKVKGPSAFAEVVLFDAITGSGELKVFTDWVLARLDADLAVLVDPAKKDKDKATYLKTSPRFRGYYASYKSDYEKLQGSICTWFGNHETELGTFADVLWTHYQVIDTKLGGGGHEYVMRGSMPADKKTPTGQGNIADAIKSLDTPTAAKKRSEVCAVRTKPKPAAKNPKPAAKKAGAKPAEGDPKPVSSATAERASVAVGKPASIVLGWLLDAADVFGGEEFAVGQIARAGFIDAVDLTDLVFGVRHPELGSERIPEGRQDLAEEWRLIRHTIVEPELVVAQAHAESIAGADATAAANATPTLKAGRSGPAPTSPPPDAGGPATATTKDAFITSLDRTTFELLPEDERTRFEAINWVPLDYPGSKGKVQDTSEANLAQWRADPAVVLFTLKNPKTKAEEWHIRGSHQDDAQALLDALARVRPGGGERRANTGKQAILTKKQFKEDPAAYDSYIEAQLDDVKGQGVRMNKYAAAKFLEMKDAANAEGVVLKIGNAFRERKVAEANAAKKANAKAVASYSSHSLGLAMDLNLRTKGSGMVAGGTTSTAMTNVIDLLRAPAYKWMFMRGADFGFYQFRMEPWHWEYNPKGFRDEFWAEMPELRPEEPVEAPKKTRKKAS